LCRELVRANGRMTQPWVGLFLSLYLQLSPTKAILFCNNLLRSGMPGKQCHQKCELCFNKVLQHPCMDLWLISCAEPSWHWSSMVCCQILATHGSPWEWFYKGSKSRLGPKSSRRAMCFNCYSLLCSLTSGFLSSDF